MDVFYIIHRVFKKGFIMSNIKCEVCGRPSTCCPACFTTIPAFSEYKGETDFKFPAIPLIEVDVSASQSSSSLSGDWNFKTSLPISQSPQTNFGKDIEVAKPALSEFFDENAGVCNCIRDEQGNVLPNPNIKRESIVNASAPSPYSPKKIRGSYGDYNVEELAKIAIEQQMRIENRKKRKRRWIRRGIVLLIIVFLILYNWDWVYFACRTLLNGADAVFQIFGLLGDLEYNPPA